MKNYYNLTNWHLHFRNLGKTETHDKSPTIPFTAREKNSWKERWCVHKLNFYME